MLCILPTFVGLVPVDYASAFQEGFAAGFAKGAGPKEPATCAISVVDPSPSFNVGIIKRKGVVKWAENNVERASRHFQYGSEWWIHRRLASLPAAQATNTSLVSAAPATTMHPLGALAHVFASPSN